MKSWSNQIIKWWSDQIQRKLWIHVEIILKFSLFFLHKVHNSRCNSAQLKAACTMTCFNFHTLPLCYLENQISHWKCHTCTTWFRTDVTILVAISIAGCSTEITEATKPPNFALLSHWQPTLQWDKWKTPKSAEASAVCQPVDAFRVLRATLIALRGM